MGRHEDSLSARIVVVGAHTGGATRALYEDDAEMVAEESEAKRGTSSWKHEEARRFRGGG